MSQLDRGGHELQHQQPHHGAVLRVLLYVRASSASATSCWAAGDMQARGFLLGGTSGRTTLNGEGLQHEDGHSHILARHDSELHQLRPDLRARNRR
jgi:hypothetical protein